jgi:hypothetical protein
MANSSLDLAHCDCSASFMYTLAHTTDNEFSTDAQGTPQIQRHNFR